VWHGESDDDGEDGEPPHRGALARSGAKEARRPTR
jgi:hypothetical protein